MSDEPTVLLERDDDGVATLTLNRPARKNGIHRAMVDLAIATLDQVASDHRNRVLVVTGAAGAFCSGMDLAEGMLPDELTFMRRVGTLCRDLHELPIPTIAKVRGAAIGFGANFALCCDLVLAAEDANFGELFAARGVALDGGGSWSLPRLVGPQKAKEIAFFSQSLTGSQAADIGMVNKAVPADSLDAVVAEWASTLAAGPRRALSMIKAEINTALETSFSAALEKEAVAQAQAARGGEVKEGVQAFFEKRKPNFRSVD
jgi:2-(1,2-epoxy-1,2-dihydrophenyl)acetyl-CoA isomerase